MYRESGVKLSQNFDVRIYLHIFVYLLVWVLQLDADILIEGIVFYLFVVSQQWQIQYPFIDELGDSFAMLVAEVKEKVYQLEPSERSKLKMIVEEKLGTKGTARKVSLSAASAEQLMDGMRQYWDFLSFEILQLVVKFLKDKELARYLREYEESIRERVTQTLEECKNNKIKPQAPPKCAIVPLKLHVDPRSYSLDKVLQMQDFLVYKMGIKLALFAGWMKGSVILYFYILESDVENVTLHLKDPECLRLLCLTLDVQNVQVGLCKGIVHGKFVEVSLQLQICSVVITKLFKPTKILLHLVTAITIVSSSCICLLYWRPECCQFIYSYISYMSEYPMACHDVCVALRDAIVDVMTI